MLIEIPDMDVILNVITAFVVGVLAIVVYYKVKSFVNFRQKLPDTEYFERLGFYEKQLIDMKIRLDALEIDDFDTKIPMETKDINETDKNKASKAAAGPKEKEVEDFQPPMDERMPNLGYSDVIEYILKLITDKAMTSRDIQITIRRTREHTSRLMKKLFEDGYVQRNTSTKPYTYSVTPKGKERLKALKPATP